LAPLPLFSLVTPYDWFCPKERACPPPPLRGAGSGVSNGHRRFESPFSTVFPLPVVPFSPPPLFWLVVSGGGFPPPSHVLSFQSVFVPNTWHFVTPLPSGTDVFFFFAHASLTKFSSQLWLFLMGPPHWPSCFQPIARFRVPFLSSGGRFLLRSDVGRLSGFLFSFHPVASSLTLCESSLILPRSIPFLGLPPETYFGP